MTDNVAALRHRTSGKSRNNPVQEKKQDVSALAEQRSGRSSRLFVFTVCLVFRLINAALTRTYDNPDEYWQAQEVAHRMVFGYGYVTWEWREKIRSYAHPLVFAAIYKLVAMLGLDDTNLLILAPRYFQACLAAVADYATYALAKRTIENNIAPYILFATLCSWFNFFMAARTLSNAMETVFTVLALNYWPFPGLVDISLDRRWQRHYRIALGLASVACILRPTNVLIWVFLGLQLLINSPQKRWAILFQTAMIGIVSLVCVILLDTRIYNGHWRAILSDPVVAPLRFFQVNVVASISLFYGTHPWHWYFSQGVPVMATTFLPVMMYGYYKLTQSEHRRQAKLYGQLVAWILLVYSLLSHKEFRFVFPILPLLLIFAAYGLSQLQGYKKSIIFGLIFTQFPMGIYLNLWHQRGVMDVMVWIKQQQPPLVGVLMPCHSTPWQSIVHNPKVDMWFLTCEPPLTHDPNYVDEADQFYANPARFLSQLTRPWPTHLVVFENLLHDPEVKQILDDGHYHICQRFFNTHFHDDKRRRGDVMVLCGGA
ncbi:Alg9-like mannosyltransferase family-domain-containing protein [Radiomyces spectabilis]|uniref:Alg9-like mannosyltransferase family-domain-containing protein n=1 Tax=Radiomyces spectabilis TaxID=64574 RepID=UPI00221EF71F|nr:Alg9-like mannosyltransferase family-domain-containing protein [Radiomyces spectabilis]KAI8381170.1 Alg9-like mannosyltransferase family-domain-containing protein [Radiomyces spectabilis]